MQDCVTRTGANREPDFNLVLIADPYEPWRFRIEGTIRLGTRGDPYEELQVRLSHLLTIREHDGTPAVGPDG